MDDVQRHHEGLRAAYLGARDALVEVLVLRIGDAVRQHLPDATHIELDAHLLEDGRTSLEAVAIHSPGASRERGSEQQDLVNALIQPLPEELGEVSPAEELAHIVL